ncbi:hypothetical protein D5R81_13930 [Parashewanella spongiae]|uniref:PKD domain-containing protein n=1 Tax=Parashewanella spongiae TaxID=342950 RepID=A0A3A6T882_9GAMM|nr:PKD domain-containing protein [Parashewanella spongiae]MCL1079148.1 PKD domain-containing protein [Parashewanella spongiae]RJY10753.1 hypothetical protein D5R81_13930 [Parashewanella spongiae]
MIIKKVLSSAALASLALISQASFATTQTSQQVSNVQSTMLQTGKGYEVKEFTMNQGFQGDQQSTTLYFIYSAQGAKNAAAEAGLPLNERDDVIQDFANGGLGGCNAASDHCFTTGDDDSYQIIIIDKDLAQQDNFKSTADMNSYLAQRGLLKARQQEIKALQSQGIKVDSNNLQTISCSSTNHGKKSFHKTLNFPFSKTDSTGGNNASLSYSVDANAQVDGSAAVNYLYKSKFCVPYKVQISQIDAEAKFALTGNISLQGVAKGELSPSSWNLYNGNISSGWFSVGPIPIQYDINLPVTAGISKVAFEARGDISLKKDLNITGNYKYACYQSKCSKVSSNFSDNGAFDKDNLSYPVLATAKVVPFVKLSVRGSLYNDLIWARAGTQEDVSIGLNGYAGNQCGNGNGIGNDDYVTSAIANVKLQARAFAEGRFFHDQNWNLLDKNLKFLDLLNPSTALSPIVRANVQGQNVNLNVSIRSCMRDLDSSFQNFSVQWGDGASDNISNLSGARNIHHSFSSPGTYNITVTHDNGAQTQSAVSIGTI